MSTEGGTMSNTNDLARRAAACKHWRWMAGMLDLARWRVAEVYPDGYLRLIHPDEDQTNDGCSPGMMHPPDLTDPATLDLSAALMDRVHDGADALLTMRGHLAEQHRYIGGLPFDVRLVLCMWLMDTDLAAKLIRAVYAKA